ncbi:YgaP family membrane protein [Dyella telluris]|uniref:DUF2892 domain-containing protein n=1 Tax=Dyella telluris TaxID=2763498 RepID=A0A7G8Q3H3_9GAMM|nr:DUF2892 domain-containing protein [Dyella telluris]QNK01331.1 DUF2892 domain-containing protein [Dyella telluris]
MSFVRTAFFVKNLPAWERMVRMLIAALIIISGLAFLASPWSWLVAIAGAGFGITGILGFCPACALAGRKLARNVHANDL